MNEVRREETFEDQGKVGMQLLKTACALDEDVREREKEKEEDDALFPSMKFHLITVKKVYHTWVVEDLAGEKKPYPYLSTYC